ncbi:MAG TPA: hypothetical protein VF306_02365, partial [Pirellulales bacterium]
WLVAGGWWQSLGDAPAHDIPNEFLRQTFTCFMRLQDSVPILRRTSRCSTVAMFSQPTTESNSKPACCPSGDAASISNCVG